MFEVLGQQVLRKGCWIVNDKACATLEKDETCSQEELGFVYRKIASGSNEG